MERILQDLIIAAENVIQDHEARVAAYPEGETQPHKILVMNELKKVVATAKKTN